MTSRAENLLRIQRDSFDVIVVGGGATGLGVALDAASRGYRTALFERFDFGKGTSSRSTKLVHGGVRYLKQGNIPLVREALREREIMRRNAPKLVTERSFIIPSYSWWEAPYYGVGLKIYDLLAGRSQFGRSRILSREETLAALPNLSAHGLRGGVQYFDGQFEDAGMALALARTAATLGAVMLNYVDVVGFNKEQGAITGVQVRDAETGSDYAVRGKVVINATGVFSDALSRLDSLSFEGRLRFSQGAHLVLDRSFLPGESALMIPKTSDGRVLFGIPWEGKLLVGTTDTEVDSPIVEPLAKADEIRYLLRTVGQYLDRRPAERDIRSVFVGIRPLLGARGRTAQLSREHSISVSPSGLVTVTGGKWTTYRKMAEECLDCAVEAQGLEPKRCVTRELELEIGERVGPDELLHPEEKLTVGDVIRAVRLEMARNVEDVLCRRSRLLFSHANHAKEVAPRVAQILAQELDRDRTWVDSQLREFNALSENFQAK